MRPVEQRERLNPAVFTIHIIRHAHKGADGLLTEEGRAAAVQFGDNLERTQFFSFVTSDISRAIETGKLIKSRYLPEEEKAPEVNPILSEEPYLAKTLHELGLDGGKWLYLETGDLELPSSKALAGKIAQFILDTLGEIKSGNIHKAGHIIAVSHVPPMTCFLGFCLAESQGKTRLDTEILQEIRGFTNHEFFPPLGGFSVTAIGENASKVLIKIGTLSLMVKISLLNELAASYLHEIAE